jgi:hypothetical protein
MAKDKYDPMLRAPTPSQAVPSQAASKFAGGLTVGKVAGMGLATVGAGFDVMSLLSSNEEGEQAARELAQTFVDSGITDYKTAMAIAQKDGQLESAIGDIGASDYAKTAAGSIFQVGDLLTGGPLGIGTGAVGVAAQADLQNKKRLRNQAFREQFDLELANRGLR